MFLLQSLHRFDDHLSSNQPSPPSFRNHQIIFTTRRLFASFSLDLAQQITFQFCTPIFHTCNFFSYCWKSSTCKRFQFQLAITNQRSTLLLLSCSNKQCRPIGSHLLYRRATSATMTSYDRPTTGRPSGTSVATSTLRLLFTSKQTTRRRCVRAHRRRRGEREILSRSRSHFSTFLRRVAVIVVIVAIVLFCSRFVVQRSQAVIARSCLRFFAASRTRSARPRRGHRA